MGQDYFLGLDMGTGSLGWAVTDDLYQVLRRHGKSLWGVRLFESANTAEERRLHRTARRNLDRRGWRIQVLQELFAEEISKVDPGFFLRMKESKYYPEDKRDADGKCPELPYALFVDKTYTDKEYHKEFLQMLITRTGKNNFVDYTRDMTKVGRYELSGKLYCVCWIAYLSTSLA